jgi:hypothetical protein
VVRAVVVAYVGNQGAEHAPMVASFTG